VADNSQKSGDDIRITAEVKDGGRTGDIVGKKYETRPTVAREMCELREWQGKHLEVSVPAYAKRQHRLRELLANPHVHFLREGCRRRRTRYTLITPR
jgi:hypothetical protein